MKKREQRRFINELIRNVKREIIRKVPQIPASWDGIELRWYIRDHFEKAVWLGTESRKRKIEYNNEVLVNNLV